MRLDIRYRCFDNRRELVIPGVFVNPGKIRGPHEPVCTETLEQFLMPGGQVGVREGIFAESILAGQMQGDILIGAEPMRGMKGRII